MIVDFTIPDVPPSINNWTRKGFRHWAQKKVVREKWRQLVQHHFPVGIPPTAGPVVVELTFFTTRECDPDNRCKVVLDALVGPVLTDDNSKVISELRLRRRPRAGLGQRRKKGEAIPPQSTRVRVWAPSVAL